MNKISKLLYISLLWTFLCPLLTSCGVTKRIVDVERVVTTYRDSTIYNVKDSIVWTPKEYYKDYTSLLDTLVIKGSNTEAKAWVDTTNHILAGTLSKEPEIAKESHIQYVDRIVEVRDTLVKTETIEVPVEVIKYRIPKWCWVLLAFNILAIGLFFLVNKPF